MGTLIAPVEESLVVIVVSPSRTTSLLSECANRYFPLGFCPFLLAVA